MYFLLNFLFLWISNILLSPTNHDAENKKVLHLDIYYLKHCISIYKFLCFISIANWFWSVGCSIFNMVSRCVIYLFPLYHSISLVHMFGWFRHTWMDVLRIRKSHIRHLKPCIFTSKILGLSTHLSFWGNW